MKKLKKVLRLAGLVLLILLAVCGLGVTGGFPDVHRERYLNKEITTEQVDKKEDEDEEQ